MTLQIVDISKFGIVCAADSAITFYDQQKKQESWPKLIPFEKLRAVIGYYGHAYIGSTKLPDWLNSFLRHSEAKTIDELANQLSKKLNNEWITPSNKYGTGFHLAGFKIIDQFKVPCFYHIWNHKGVSESYLVSGNGFSVTSDFPERDATDYMPDKLDKFFESQGSFYTQIYRNGALNPYNQLAESLYNFLRNAWGRNLIAEPTKLDHWAWCYRFQLETVKQMYSKLFTTGKPPVGRKIVVLMIPPTGKIKQLPNKRGH